LSFRFTSEPQQHGHCHKREDAMTSDSAPTEYQVTELPEQRWRQAHELFAAAAHWPQLTDSWWEKLSGLCTRGRVHGVLEPTRSAPERLERKFDEQDLLAMVSSFPTSVAVPGGTALPAAGGLAVAVRPDRRRRGLMTMMMQAHLRDLRARGEVFEAMRASSAAIHERFGYGVATRTATLHVNTSKVRLIAEAPTAEKVRPLLNSERTLDAVRAIVGEVHRKCPRSGWLDFPQAYWDHWAPWGSYDSTLNGAVHEGPDGIDGYLLWVIAYSDLHVAPPRLTARVVAAAAADGGVMAQLWRFLLEVDLLDAIEASGRPLDDPLPLLMADRRACRTVAVDDELWLRLLDVESALRNRRWAPTPDGDDVVLEVVDHLLPENTAMYSLGPEGVARTRRAPDLRCGPTGLAMAYLGDVSVRELVATGRMTVENPDALDRAEAVFATPAKPWCGFVF
jgi:predicted acetyltransferase